MIVMKFFDKLQDYILKIFEEGRYIEMCLIVLFLPLLGLIVMLCHTIDYFRASGFNK